MDLVPNLLAEGNKKIQQYYAHHGRLSRFCNCDNCDHGKQITFTDMPFAGYTVCLIGHFKCDRGGVCKLHNRVINLVGE